MARERGDDVCTAAFGEREELQGYAESARNGAVPDARHGSSQGLDVGARRGDGDGWVAGQGGEEDHVLGWVAEFVVGECFLPFSIFVFVLILGRDRDRDPDPDPDPDPNPTSGNRKTTGIIGTLLTWLGGHGSSLI